MTGRHPAGRAVAFLTPLGGAAVPSPESLLWFPAVGAAVGSAVGAAWWAAAQVWPPLPAAAVALGVDLALTGMLHLDGLVDSADGLLAHLDRPRRLEVMAAPDVGAFGTAAAGVTLLLRFAVLAALAPTVLLPAALWCLSRTAMAVIAVTQPYARAGGGLASAFLGGRPRVAVIAAAGAAGALVPAWLWRPLPGVAAVAAGALAAAGVAALARRRIGGFTGDVLGAAGVMAETAGLLVAAARW